MKLLFVSSHFYLPQSHGGLSNTLHQLSLGLRDRGHETIVLSGYRRGYDRFGFVSRARMKLNKTLRGLPAARDRVLGYPVWRSWNPLQVLPEVVDREQPDLIVVKGGTVVPIAHAARSLDVPVLVHVHDVEFEWHGGNFTEIANIPLVANSEFTARTFEAEFGVQAEVIYPSIDLDRYRCETTREDVTLINPIIRKGLRLAVEIARLCPEIPFRFVGDFPDEDEDDNPFDPAGCFLPNITYQPFTSDPQEIYGSTKLLLVPSQWEEAFGRVVAEAQVSGIPALTSLQGGIPEAVCGGGISIPHDARPEVWAEELRTIWNDERLYRELSGKALEASKRDELRLENQTAEHEAFAMRVVEAES